MSVRGRELNGYFAMTNEEVAERLNLTTEQVRYAFESGIKKIQQSRKRRGLLNGFERLSFDEPICR